MKIFKYELTDSTNTRAKEYARCEGAEMPAVFIADEQSAGRGRRGRSFDSAKGRGLYMSVLFRPSAEFDDAAKITVRAAVAASRAISELCGVPVGIKWVNDIYFDKRKLAGILTEGEISEDGGFSYAVCGIGVNLLSRDFPLELSDKVTTVEDISGKRVGRDELCERIVSEFFSDMKYSEVISEYREKSIVVGKRAEMRRISGESFFATVLDITDSGALLVLRDGGVREELISAEVSVVLGD